MTTHGISQNVEVEFDGEVVYIRGKGPHAYARISLTYPEARILLSLLEKEIFLPTPAAPKKVVKPKEKVVTIRDVVKPKEKAAVKPKKKEKKEAEK